MIDLKRLRKEKRITQKELAQLLSCGQSFIANVENGRRDLPPVKIEILERKFGNICSYITNDIEEIKPIENKPKTIAPKQHSQTEKMEVSTDILFAGADAFSRQLIQLMNEKLIAPYSRPHPSGCGRGGGQMRIQRQTVAPPRTFRPQLLNRCRYRIITTKTDAIQRSVRLRFCRKQVMNYQNDSIRRQDRLLDQPEATELLRRGEYGILCMQRPEGGGYGVPLNYVWDEADAIYIHCAPEGRKLHCLRECDRVTFCIVGKTQVLPARFTTFYESILLDCRARTGLTAEERRRALDHLIGKYSPEYKTIGRQYVEKSFHRTEIIRLDILSWSGKCKDNLHPGTTPPGANSNRT